MGAALDGRPAQASIRTRGYCRRRTSCITNPLMIHAYEHCASSINGEKANAVFNKANLVSPKKVSFVVDLFKHMGPCDTWGCC